MRFSPRRHTNPACSSLSTLRSSPNDFFRIPRQMVPLPVGRRRGKSKLLKRANWEKAQNALARLGVRFAQPFLDQQISEIAGGAMPSLPG
jgi:hypothetical protein